MDHHGFGRFRCYTLARNNVNCVPRSPQGNLAPRLEKLQKGTTVRADAYNNIQSTLAAKRSIAVPASYPEVVELPLLLLAICQAHLCFSARLLVFRAY